MSYGSKLFALTWSKEGHAIQTNLLVYARFSSRNIPSDSQEASLQTVHIFIV